MSRGNSQNKSTLLKVILLGDGGVGKSSLMNRYVCNSFDEKCFHTIGVEFLNKEVSINSNAYTLQVGKLAPEVTTIDLSHNRRKHVLMAWITVISITMRGLTTKATLKNM